MIGKKNKPTILAASQPNILQFEEYYPPLTDESNGKVFNIPLMGAAAFVYIDFSGITTTPFSCKFLVPSNAQVRLYPAQWEYPLFYYDHLTLYIMYNSIIEFIIYNNTLFFNTNELGH